MFSIISHVYLFIETMYDEWNDQRWLRIVCRWKISFFIIIQFTISSFQNFPISFNHCREARDDSWHQSRLRWTLFFPMNFGRKFRDISISYSSWKVTSSLSRNGGFKNFEGQFLAANYEIYHPYLLYDISFFSFTVFFESDTFLTEIVFLRISSMKFQYLSSLFQLILYYSLRQEIWRIYIWFE